ncbi:hypothetical protein AOLI_G00216310 [Acnodon oligacanthus]
MFRRVLNINGWYFLATEYLEGHQCQKKVAGWSQDILEQLDPAHRAMFPAILTYRDLAVCKQFQVPGVEAQPVAPSPPMAPVPSPHWLLTIHAEDVRTRISEMKARITSVFGSILKVATATHIHPEAHLTTSRAFILTIQGSKIGTRILAMVSTETQSIGGGDTDPVTYSVFLVTKKLAGAAARTAAWVTNVGSEYGQVLMSVLTAHKGDRLLPMEVGLMRRYREARVPPPKLLYVDEVNNTQTRHWVLWAPALQPLHGEGLCLHFRVGCMQEAVQAEMEEKQGIVGMSEDQLNSKLTAKLLIVTVDGGGDRGACLSAAGGFPWHDGHDGRPSAGQ